MNKEKQIEEMAKDINIADHEYCDGRCIGCEHKSKRIKDCACIDIAIATGLIGKGYRKASDVAREIFEEIEKFQRSPIPESKPVYILRGDEYTKLKKKYTEEGK